MKRTLSALILLGFFHILLYAAPIITIHKENGGLNGYYTVEEDHDSDGSSLNCVNPGNESCIFTIDPTVVGKSETVYNPSFLINLAETEITNGNYNGTIIHNGEIIITWSGSLTNYTITIDHYSI